MSYTLIVTPFAEAQLDALPPSLAHFVRQQLQRLLEDPVTLSQPTTMLQPRGQMFEIHDDSAGVSVWVGIIFRYGQDEQTLHVEHIAVEFG